uniref:G protein-coupled receptor 137Ba n=1 Tax=Paramormyrops kingsleyae TaxID=1676925 RepID=A0A3B3QQI7_9TELE|nr:integral membrane protein GPR137B-like isoform X1 [Paramormyrops kingsleyae]XP_023651961.1 integral membrane protein GPR137B-like isoform X1 [Paramormyrops kingsleyae]
MQAVGIGLGLELPPTLDPEGPSYFNLGLTAAYMTFYSLIFIFVYIQLWLVLRYGHKRLSCQTAFLSLCLLWASLRAVLLSFSLGGPGAAATLDPFTFWLLHCFPTCLQFFTLSLMNVYFTQVVFKARSKYVPELLKYRPPLYMAILLADLFFLVVNLTCTLLMKMTETDPKTTALVRVAVNDTLFVLCALSLSLCLCKISKMSLANTYLESKGTSVCQVTVTAATVVILYTSRSCYNLVILTLTSVGSISFADSDFYDVSNQESLQTTLGDKSYIVFGVILFAWELLPASLMVFFFRVRRPAQERSGPSLPGHGFSSRAYFFDNPRRYDSDDNLLWNTFPHDVRASFVAGYDRNGLNNSFINYFGNEGLHSSTAQGALNPY